jgi:hypothetical protein
LLDEVADFMDGALRRGDAGVVIATPLHRQGIDRRLQRAREAVGAEHWFPGEFIALDADETLQRFMREDWPDETLFMEVIGDVLKRASRDGARSVRAFGEMVALLFERRQQAAAVRLEELWNALSQQQAFSLYCAYPLNLFTRSEDRLAFHRVCSTHTHVLTPAMVLSDAGSMERDMVLAQSQQKSDVLEAEMDKRTRAEATLRMREKELADFLDNAAEGLSRPGGTGAAGPRARGIHRSALVALPCGPGAGPQDRRPDACRRGALQRGGEDVLQGWQRAPRARAHHAGGRRRAAAVHALLHPRRDGAAAGAGGAGPRQ